MENIMNFLSEYYLYFFIAAGVLVFALIGFVIDSKKKSKNVVKEEVSSVNSPVETVPTELNNTPVAPIQNTDSVQNVEPITPIVDEVSPNESASEISEAPAMETPVVNTGASEETKETHDTVEIFTEPISFDEQSKNIVPEPPVVSETPEATVVPENNNDVETL